MNYGILVVDLGARPYVQKFVGCSLKLPLYYPTNLKNLFVDKGIFSFSCVIPPNKLI